MTVFLVRFSVIAGQAVDKSEVVEYGIPDLGILRTFGRQVIEDISMKSNPTGIGTGRRTKQPIPGSGARLKLGF